MKPVTNTKLVMQRKSVADVEKRLSNIIKVYKKYKDGNPDSWIEFAKSQINLKGAIRVSSLSINQDNRRNPHQYRLEQKTLDATCDELLLIERKLKVAKTFDELYKLIMSIDVFGLGPLTRYDIATRIGAYLKLYPDRIYLHAGTRTGAKKLLGKVEGEFILKGDLPKPFRVHDLQCSEIEDILCIFKDQFTDIDPKLFLVKSKC